MCDIYGKIESGVFSYAPLNILYNGSLVCNITKRPELLEELGYKIVREVGVCPSDNFREVYNDMGDYIALSYELLEEEANLDATEQNEVFGIDD